MKVIFLLVYSQDEMHIDLANMLDTQLSGGEPSPSHQAPPWPAPGDMTPVMGNDETQPGKLSLIFLLYMVCLMYGSHQKYHARQNRKPLELVVFYRLNFYYYGPNFVPQKLPLF